MEEYKITGIVLGAKDFKDSDKLIDVFSLELGKITMQLRGVKKSNAKLKYAALPFCFATYFAVRKNGFFIVSQVDVIDTFFDLTKDYDKLKRATLVLKVCEQLSKEGYVAENLFIHAINTLKSIAYEDMDLLVITKFLLKVVSDFGYGLQFNKCNNCNCLFQGSICLNIESGGVVCGSCAEYHSVAISKQEFVSLKIIYNTDFDKLHTIKFGDDVLKNLVFVLMKYYEGVFSLKLTIEL